MPSSNAPTGPADAIAKGFAHIGAHSELHKAKGAAFALAAGGPVDCQTAPPGTLCFDYEYPGGGHVVGYCDANGVCQLYSKD